MTSTHSRLRSQSLSGKDERSGRPQPAKFIFDAPKWDFAKRAAMPRATTSLSNSNNVAAIEKNPPVLTLPLVDDLEGDDDEYNMAREQVDREALRDLAQFFRNTAPPTAHQGPNLDNCFGRPGSASDHRRWSLRQFRNGNKNRGRRPVSLQLGDNAVRRTTTAGHSYIAISPPSDDPQPQALLPPISVLNAFGGDGDKPRRSRHLQDALHNTMIEETPSNKDFANEKEQMRRSSKGGDVAAVVSRTSSNAADRNSYKLSIRVTAADKGVRSFMKMVDEWLEDQDRDELKDPALEEIHPALRHQTKDSGVTLLTPGEAEKLEAEKDANAPKIILKPALQQPSATDEEIEKETTAPASNPIPVTPPPTNIPKMGFPDVDERRLSSPETAISPRSIESQSKVALSAFPNTGRGSISKATKQPKKPSNIILKPTLEVPKSEPLPESPGFPTMLAKMTFPSPPESIRSHSASNSMSSMDPHNRSPTTPPLTGRFSVSPPRSNLDQRLMQQSERPPLRQVKSDISPKQSDLPLRAVSASALTPTSGDFPDESHMATPVPPSRHSDTGVIPSSAARDNDAEKTPAASRSTTATGKRTSIESEETKVNESQRQSTSSTVDSSTPSSDLYRDSVQSDTSVASNATEVYKESKKRHATHDSEESAILGGNSDRFAIRQKRSSTPASFISMSSTATSATATSLAERRMARRARVREKLQRDLESSKSSLKPRQPAGCSATPLDSPVLGYFPHNDPSKRPSASPLAQAAAINAEAVSDKLKGQPSRETSRRSSAPDITDLIPETVHEATTPVSATMQNSEMQNPEEPERWSFTPIMVETTEPGSPAPAIKEEEEVVEEESALKFTPIMVVVNIEARSPTSSLRPLSLLANAAPPILPPRSTLRPDGKTNMRQRPLPIRVTKNPLDLTVNTSLASKRNSTPMMHSTTTPPDSHPSPRMSMPVFAIDASAVHASSADREVSKETQWLTAHQRQTTHEWRLAALRERMRRELMEERETTSADIVVNEDETEVESAADAEKFRKLREKHCRTTLRALNGNALTAHRSSSNSNSNRRWGMSAASSNNSDGEKTPTSDISTCGAEGPSADLSHISREVEQRLLRTLVPLLESMDQTLKNMQRTRSSRAIEENFVHSALVMAQEQQQQLPSVDGETTPRDE